MLPHAASVAEGHPCQAAARMALTDKATGPPRKMARQFGIA
jgi:hypothetical protein